jgi:hypothetical protein
MTISSLGFPVGSALGGVLIDAAGLRTVIIAIACGYLGFSLLPLLAPALRQLPDPRSAVPDVRAARPTEHNAEGRPARGRALRARKRGRDGSGRFRP